MVLGDFVAMNTSACYNYGVELAVRYPLNFLKMARQSDDIDSFDDSKALTGLVLGAGAGRAVNAGLGALAAGGAALERRLTPEDFYVGLEGALRKGLKVPTNVGVAYGPINPVQSSFSSLFNTVVTSNKVSPGVLSHELAHAAMNSPLTRAATAVGAFGNKMIPISLLAQIATDPESTATNVLRYGPAVLLAPTLLEEGMATARGMRALARIGGGRAALRALLPMLPAFGTYVAGAATPIIGGKIIHHFTKD